MIQFFRFVVLFLVGAGLMYGVLVLWSWAVAFLFTHF